MQNIQTHFDKGNAEFLTFIIGGEEYGINILKVKEIRAYEKVTKIVNSPPFIIGVINLRGCIVPIVDMRVKYNLGPQSYDQFTVVIVLVIEGSLIGMVVDSVNDVVSLAADQILPAPQIGSDLNFQFIFGVGAIDGRMILLTDLERWLSAEDMVQIHKAWHS